MERCPASGDTCDPWSGWCPDVASADDVTLRTVSSEEPIVVPCIVYVYSEFGGASAVIFDAMFEIPC